MKISTAQFAKKSFSTGSGSFAGDITPSANSFAPVSFATGSGSFAPSISVSSNQFSKKSFVKGLTGWEGPNTSASAFGRDDIFGGEDSVFGEGVFGGLSHFGLRNKYDVSH